MLAPGIMGIGGKLYMDYHIIGIIVFTVGMYLLTWSFRSSLNNLEKRLQNKLDKKIDIPEEIKLEEKLIPLKEAIDYLIEYQVRHLGSSYSLLMMAQAQAYETTHGHFQPKPAKKTAIEQQYLADILGYAQEGEITIYGQTQITIKNLHPLPLAHIRTEPWFFKENWDDNYTSIYQQGKLLYTNLQVKRAELKQLVEKYKLSKEPVNL